MSRSAPTAAMSSASMCRLTSTWCTAGLYRRASGALPRRPPRVQSPLMVRPRTPKGRARETMVRLADEYPGTPVELCALHHENPFQLLAATILSAQTTDERVNMVTPTLFARYPTPE